MTRLTQPTHHQGDSPWRIERFRRSITDFSGLKTLVCNCCWLPPGVHQGQQLCLSLCKVDSLCFRKLCDFARLGLLCNLLSCAKRSSRDCLSPRSCEQSSTMTVMNTSRSRLARDARTQWPTDSRETVSASKRCFWYSTLRKRSSPPEYLALLDSAPDCVQKTGNSVTSNPCAAQWLSKSSNVNLPTNWCAHAGSCNRIFATPCATGVWIGCQSICVPGSPSQTAKKERASSKTDSREQRHDNRQGSPWRRLRGVS